MIGTTFNELQRQRYNAPLTLEQTRVELQRTFGDEILVSLMCQYVPWGKAKNDPKLGRVITRREYDKVKDVLFALELDGFTQDLSAATADYIPDWDD